MWLRTAAASCCVRRKLLPARASQSDFSTLLKRDLWVANTAQSSDGIRGAIGFRQVRGTNIYATGQPTEDAITNILGIVKERSPDITSVVWVCLREEPLVMINGKLVLVVTAKA